MRYLSLRVLTFMFILVGFTSCLKDTDGNHSEDTAGNVVEFANTGDNVASSTSKYPRFTVDLGSVGEGESVSFNMNVAYSGAEAAPQDITVNIALDQATLDLFNTQNGTDYEIPAAGIVEFPTTVVIKKGTRKTTAEIKVTRTAGFDFNVNYALPVKITSASTGTISGNFGNALYSFAARNSYDGLYRMEALTPMKDVIAPALTGYYPLEMALITYTGNSVYLYDINSTFSAGAYHPIKSGAATSAYGSFSPIFYFDNDGNVTEVSNYYGQESGGFKRSGGLDESGVNKVTFNGDGSVASIDVSYFMYQSNVSPFAVRTYFHEKFTYLGGR
ncbi:MAG: DUF1735 domain-containing protein [Flavitalea sp.]